ESAAPGAVCGAEREDGHDVLFAEFRHHVQEGVAPDVLELDGLGKGRAVLRISLGVKTHGDLRFAGHGPGGNGEEAGAGEIRRGKDGAELHGRDHGGTKGICNPGGASATLERMKLLFVFVFVFGCLALPSTGLAAAKPKTKHTPPPDVVAAEDAAP